MLEWIHGKNIDINSYINMSKTWNIKYPKEYLEVVEKFNGAKLVCNVNGIIVDAEILMKNYEPISINLLSINEDNKNKILNMYNLQKNRLPDKQKIIPFARTSVGDIIFFDYRKNEINPSIVLLQHDDNIFCGKEDLIEYDLQHLSLEEAQEQAFYHIADSFQDFLDKFEPNMEQYEDNLEIEDEFEDE